MQIIGLQLDINWEDKPANYARVKSFVDRFKPVPGSLLVLPEMFATGFSMNVAAIVEKPGGPTECFLGDLARHYGLFVAGGTVSAGVAKAGRNEAAIFDGSGSLICRYCKNYPFTLGGESNHYEAGKEIVQFTWDKFAVAPFICYDLRFPELFRAAVRRGANLFLVMANWPNKREQHWITLLRARAIENQAFMVGVNRCGQDPKHVYSGRSMIIDPHGEILVDAGSTEGLFAADIDFAVVESWRRDFPALEDMR